MESGRSEQEPPLDRPRPDRGDGPRIGHPPVLPDVLSVDGVGVQRHDHGMVSMAWGVIIFVAVGLSAVAYRGWFRIYAIATDVVLIGFGAASGIAIQGIEQNDTPWAGAFERINAYSLMVWFAVLAVMVIRHQLNRRTEERSLTEIPTRELVTV